MQNFKIEHEKKEYWISRSCTVVGAVIAIEESGIYVLANKRGKGCSDNVGLWNLPCGYLDYDESLPQACAREIKEECGVTLDHKYLVLHSVNSNPLENKQNVSIRFCTFVNQRFELGQPSGEQDEVEEVSWIDVTKISEYQWAYNHQYLIAEFVDYGRSLLEQQRNSEQPNPEVAETSESDSSI